MYQLLTGDYYPFVAESLDSEIDLHEALKANSKKHFPSIVSNDCSTLIWQMLEIEPSKRPSAIDIISSPIVLDKA
jgi:serine/threonine protein kinase